MQKSPKPPAGIPQELGAEWLPALKACWCLSAPLAAAEMAQTATTFIDAMMMGWLGEETLAAGALGTVLFHFAITVSSGIVSALSPLVAIAYGAQKLDQMGSLTRQTLGLAALLGMLGWIPLWYGEPLLLALGQSASTAALASTYLQAISWGLVPALAFAVLKNVVTALSRPRPVMLIMVGGTLLNSLGNAVLMFGWFGFPELGLAGIGWSSTLSFGVMAVALGLYVLWQPQFQGLQMFWPVHRPDQKTQESHWRDLLRIGLPVGGLVAVEFGMFAATALLMGTLGTTPLAAHQMAIQTAAVAFAVVRGISYGATVQVGQQWGAANRPGTRAAGWVALALGSVFMLGVAAVFWFFPERIVALFLDIGDEANQPVVEYACRLLGVAAVFQWVDGGQVIAAGALRGLKDTRIPFLIGVLAYWGVGLPTGYWLGFGLGMGGFGLWWGLAIGLTVAAVILTVRFARLTR
ncbi:MAG: MATE family efflux transporter [Thermostichus sp. DG02_5_bins_236]